MQENEVDITIIVKALNEEKRIEGCLRSALAALASLPELKGEVILADSVSTDRTVEIAAGLGVRIVQFCHAADRNCGAALQLGYQFARGRYVYVLDGDMQLVEGFLNEAYAYLEKHKDVAGVGGKLIDTHVRTAADRHRIAIYSTLKAEQQVENLGGGGLYRRDAIERVGYLANRWLPAFEEAELGVRLRCAGYRLVRLGASAVTHSGHEETSAQMVRRLWRNGRIDAIGAFLRCSLGRPWFRQTVKCCWYAFVAPVLHLFGIVLALVGWMAGLPWQAVIALPLGLWLGVVALLAYRKRSLSYGFVGVVNWHLYSLGAARGAGRPVRDPMQQIDARELTRLSRVA